MNRSPYEYEVLKPFGHPFVHPFRRQFGVGAGRSAPTPTPETLPDPFTGAGLSGLSGSAPYTAAQPATVAGLGSWFSRITPKFLKSATAQKIGLVALNFIPVVGPAVAVGASAVVANQWKQKAKHQADLDQQAFDSYMKQVSGGGLTFGRPVASAGSVVSSVKAPAPSQTTALRRTSMSFGLSGLGSWSGATVPSRFKHLKKQVLPPSMPGAGPIHIPPSAYGPWAPGKFAAQTAALRRTSMFFGLSGLGDAVDDQVGEFFQPATGGWNWGNFWSNASDVLNTGLKTYQAVKQGGGNAGASAELPPPPPPAAPAAPSAGGGSSWLVPALVGGGLLLLAGRR